MISSESSRLKESQSEKLVNNSSHLKPKLKVTRILEEKRDIFDATFPHN